MKTKSLAFLCLFIFLFSASVWAADSASLAFSSDKATAKTGDEVTLTLQYQAGPDLAAMTLELAIDEHFALVSITSAGIPEGDLSYNAVGGAIYLLYVDGAGGNSPMKAGSTLITIRLTALSQTGGGAPPLMVHGSSFSGVDAGGQVISFEGAVQVGEVDVNDGETIKAPPQSQMIVMEGESEDPANYPDQPAGALPGATGPDGTDGGVGGEQSGGQSGGAEGGEGTGGGEGEKSPGGQNRAPLREILFGNGEDESGVWWIVLIILLGVAGAATTLYILHRRQKAEAAANRKRYRQSGRPPVKRPKKDEGKEKDEEKTDDSGDDDKEQNDDSGEERNTD